MQKKKGGGVKYLPFAYFPVIVSILTNIEFDTRAV